MILNLATIGLPGCDDPDAPLSLGVDDDEEPALRVSVETKTVLVVAAARVWMMDGLRIEEGRGCEAEVKTSRFIDLVAFVFIPFKLQILQGLSRYCCRLVLSVLSSNYRAFFRGCQLGIWVAPTRYSAF